MIFCPHCKKQTLTLYMGGNFGTYICKSCGYLGPLFIEAEKRETKKQNLKPADEPLYYRQIFKSAMVHFYDPLFWMLSLGQDTKIRKQFLMYLPKKMKMYLDMATGTGSVACAIKKAYTKTTVMGIDLSETMLFIAQRKAEQQHLAIAFLLQNIEKTHFKKECFDAITLSFGLHELPFPHRKNVLKEAHRLLKKGGVFIIMDYHLPQNIFLQLLLRLHIFFTETYAQSILIEDVDQELQRYGFTNVKKVILYGGLVQLVYGKK